VVTLAKGRSAITKPMPAVNAALTAVRKCDGTRRRPDQRAADNCWTSLGFFRARSHGGESLRQRSAAYKMSMQGFVNHVSSPPVTPPHAIKLSRSRRSSQRLYMAINQKGLING